MFVEESEIAYTVSLDETTPVDLRLAQLTTASAAATAFVDAGLTLTEDTTAAFTQLLSAMIALLSVETNATPVLQQQVEEVAWSVSAAAVDAVVVGGSDEAGDGDTGARFC